MSARSAKIAKASALTEEMPIQSILTRTENTAIGEDYLSAEAGWSVCRVNLVPKLPQDLRRTRTGYPLHQDQSLPLQWPTDPAWRRKLSAFSTARKVQSTQGALERAMDLLQDTP